MFWTTWLRSPELVPSKTTAAWFEPFGPGDPPPASLLTLSSPDCDPLVLLEDVIRLTSMKDGPVKQAASSFPAWNSATTNGPRTSVSRGCQGPGSAPPSGARIDASWLWQSASVPVGGAAGPEAA